MHLRRRQTCPECVGHRIHHIFNKSGDFRRSGVNDRFRRAQQQWVAHSGNLENSHISQYGAIPPKGKQQALENCIFTLPTLHSGG